MILFLILSIYQYPRILTTDLISPPSSQPVLEKVTNWEKFDPFSGYKA